MNATLELEIEMNRLKNNAQRLRECFTETEIVESLKHEIAVRDSVIMELKEQLKDTQDAFQETIEAQREHYNARIEELSHPLGNDYKPEITWFNKEPADLCPSCAGEGFNDGIRCSYCNGNGRIVTYFEEE